MPDRLKRAKSWLNSEFVEQSSTLISVIEMLEKRLGPLKEQVKSDLEAGPAQVTMREHCRIIELACLIEKTMTQLNMVKQTMVTFDITDGD